MFFFIAMFVAGFILQAFLSPKMKVENAKASGLDDFEFPRSDEGDPVGRFWGTLKLSAPNTIGLAGFKTVPIKKKVKTGLFSSKKVITGYKYYATVNLAWALGPDVVYRKMWFGDHLVWTGCLFGEGCENEITLSLPELYGGSEDGKRGGIGGVVAMYCGSFTQSRDAVLAAQVSADVPAYRGTAHMVFRDFWWGNNASVDAVAVEAAHFTNTLGLAGSKHIMPNGLDANPIEVLHDLFVTGWGNLGYDAAKISTATWQDVAEVVHAEENGMSLSVANATKGEDVAKQILRQINAIVYEDQTTGLVEIKLIRKDYDLDDLPVLTPSDISEIRNYSKKLWNETNNVVRLKYTDRADNYAKDKTAVAKDSSLLRFQGRERPAEVTMPGVYVAALANALAARELSNLNVPLFSCEILLNRSQPDIKPGDPFILAWPEYGITQMVMRVRKMGLGTYEDGKVALYVVQDEYSLDATVIAPPAPSGYVPTTLEPQDIVTSVFFEIPAFLDYQAALGTLAGHTRFAAFAKAPTSYTLGYSAYIEEPGDDATVLSDAPYTSNATLALAIDRFDGFADGVIPAVEVEDASEDITSAYTPRQAGGLFLIGSELFAYESATDGTGGAWTLNNVHRAFLDTGWFAHAPGSTVWFFEGQEGFYDSSTPVGDVFDTYLLDKTSSGSSSVDSATVVELTATGRVERVIAPDYVTIDGIRDAWQELEAGDTVELDARPRNRNDVAEAWYEDDAASTAEAGTTYRISFEVGGVVTEIADDETLPYDVTITDAMTGECVLLLEAKKDGLYSIAAAPMPILVGGVRITEDGDARYTEDGELRLMED